MYISLLADPVGFEPDPGPTLENKPDSDPTFQKNLDPDPIVLRAGSGSNP